jgi:hypothetical protein
VILEEVEEIIGFTETASRILNKLQARWMSHIVDEVSFLCYTHAFLPHFFHCGYWPVSLLAAGYSFWS